MLDLRQLGTRLQGVRADRGMTLQDLAERSGVSVSMLSSDGGPARRRLGILRRRRAARLRQPGPAAVHLSCGRPHHATRAGRANGSFKAANDLRHSVPTAQPSDFFAADFFAAAFFVAFLAVVFFAVFFVA